MLGSRFVTQHLWGWPLREQLPHLEIFRFPLGKSSIERTDLCRVQSLRINLGAFSPAVRAVPTALCRQVLGDVGVQRGHQALLLPSLLRLALAEAPATGTLREFLLGFGCVGQSR